MSECHRAAAKSAAWNPRQKRFEKKRLCRLISLSLLSFYSALNILSFSDLKFILKPFSDMQMKMFDYFITRSLGSKYKLSVLSKISRSFF